MKKHRCLLPARGEFSPLSLFFFIIFLSLYSQNSKAFEFNFLPLRFDLYGSIIDSPNVIVYGNYGIFLFSSDFGSNWNIRSIGNYSAIRGMQKDKDTIWGILDNGFLIFSHNKGINWQKIKIPLDSNDKFLCFFVDENSIFIRTVKSIIKLNKHGQIEKKLSDSVFLPRSDFPNSRDILPQKDSVYLRYKIYPFYDKIIVDSKYEKSFGNDGFYVVDKNLDSLKYISIRGKINIQDTLPLMEFNVYYLKGKPILRIWGNLYFTDSLFNKWEYFFNDTVFLNYQLRKTQEYKRRNSIVISPRTYFFCKDTLMGLEKEEIVRYLDSSQTGYIPLYNKYKIKKHINVPKDSLVDFGTSFDDVYFATYLFRIGSINISGETIYYCLFLDPKVSSYSNKLMVLTMGNPESLPLQNRFLLLSQNDFSEWHLVSLLQGIPLFILNDSTYFFVKDREIYRTLDGGNTFKPLEYYSMGDTIGRFPGRYSMEKVTKIFLDSTGKGYIWGLLSNSFTSYFTPTVTYNFFKNISYPWEGKTSSGAFPVLPKNEPTNISLLGDSFLFGYSSTEVFPFRYSIHIGDTNFVDFITPVQFQKGFGLKFILPNSSVNDFYMFGLAHPPQDSSFDSSRISFEIRHSNDTGKTYTIVHKLPYLNPIQFYQHGKDSVFFTTSLPDRLYLFDRKTNELKLLWEAEEGDFRPMLMVISDHFYLVGRGLFLENADRSDLTQWREGEWDYGKPNFESVIFRGNVAIAGLSDSLRPFNYYKITLKKQEPSIVKEPTIEKRYYTTHFWASDPYPQPAKVRVKARVAWDGSFDLREAIDGVYDTMGRKVEGKERIRVDARNTTSGELEWECSGVPAGIYFILIRWRGGSETVPVVVE